MREFEVEFEMRKGLGPDTYIKSVPVGLDDLEPGLDESVIREHAVQDAEGQLRKADDFPVYGKTWILRAVYDA